MSPQQSNKQNYPRTAPSPTTSSQTQFFPAPSASPISYSSILLQNPVNSQQQNGSTQSRLDCNATRDNLMETVGSVSGRHEGKGTFIPKCTADGYYEQVQCMPDLHFCWCVNRVTGQTIKSIKVSFLWYSLWRLSDLIHSRQTLHKHLP